MKRYLFFVLMLACQLVIAQQWEWKTFYTGFDGRITAIQITSEDTLFAIGEKLFVRSVDGGKNWENLKDNNPNLAQPFNGIHFVNSKIGFAYRASITGGPLIMKTVDGGDTWEAMRNSSAISQGVNQMHFPDPKIGYLVGGVGSGNYMAFSDDGGKSWTRRNPADLNSSATLWFTNGSTGFSGSNRILKTTDSGKTWTGSHTKMTNGQIESYFFFDTLNAIALSSDYDIFKTQNGGKNWAKYQTPLSPGFLGSGIAFLNKDTGYLVGGKSDEPLVSNNGGKSWIRDSEFPSGIKSVSIAAFKDKMIAVGGMDGKVAVRIKKQSTNAIHPVMNNASSFLFPNPSGGPVFVGGSHDPETKLTVCTTSGKNIYQGPARSLILKPGIYYYRFSSPEKGLFQHFKRLVIY